MNTYGLFFRLQGPRRETDSSDHELLRWALVSNKRMALRWARQASALVGVHRNQTRHDTWDAPTFRVTMDVIADFRG